MNKQQVKSDPSAQDLLKMKKELDDKAAIIQKLEGQKETYYAQLKKDFDCSDMEEGENKFDGMKREREEKQKQLDGGVADLKQNYEWEFVG